MDRTDRVLHIPDRSHATHKEELPSCLHDVRTAKLAHLLPSRSDSIARRRSEEKIRAMKCEAAALAARPQSHDRPAKPGPPFARAEPKRLFRDVRLA
jgi:hypothetical protein